jgi:hypothetical protein
MPTSDDYTSAWHFRDALERGVFARQALLYLGRLNTKVADLAERASASELPPLALHDVYMEVHLAYRLRYWAFESILDLLRQGVLTVPESLASARAALKVALALFRRRYEPTLELLREARQEFAQLLPRCDHQIIIAHDVEVPEICIYDEYSWMRRAYEAHRGSMLGARWDEIESTANRAAVPSKTSAPAPVCSAAISRIRLTRSQTDCADILRSYWLAQQSGGSVGGYSLRPPLIAAQSGAGKTRLIRWFAELMRVPLLILDTGSWLLAGSRAETPTLTILREFHQENDRGIVFCDEIDKAFGRDGGWWQGVNMELMSFVDGRLLWPLELLNKKQTNFFVVGAGTWQSVFRANGRHLGFNRNDPDGDVVRAIEAGFGGESIPVELGYRFDPPLLLLPPDADEFRERIEIIRKEAGFLPVDPLALTALVEDATSSGRGQRWLEHYASRMLRERCLAEEREGWLHW